MTGACLNEGSTHIIGSLQRKKLKKEISKFIGVVLRSVNLRDLLPRHPNNNDNYQQKD